MKECYNRQGSESAKWQHSMADLRDYLLSETRARQKKDSTEMVQVKNRLETTRKFEAKHGPSPQILARQKQLKTRLFELECPEAQGLASKAAAVRMAERSDACTKAYFRTFKAQAKQQWINKIKTARWKDGQEPAWTGTEQEPKKIPEALANYYKMLFSEKKINESDAKDLQEVMEGQKKPPPRGRPFSCQSRARQNLCLARGFGVRECALT